MWHSVVWRCRTIQLKVCVLVVFLHLFSLYETCQPAIISTVHIFSLQMNMKKISQEWPFHIFTSVVPSFWFFLSTHTHTHTKANNVGICIEMNFLVPTKQCGLSFSFHRCRSCSLNAKSTFFAIHMAHTLIPSHLDWREQHFQRIFSENY